MKASRKLLPFPSNPHNHYLIQTKSSQRQPGKRTDTLYLLSLIHIYAPAVIGVGPGFCAGKDVDAVIETQRGHNLGRVIYEGEAAPNTGIPGMIGGYAKERVIHAPATGKLHILRQIGEIVEAGDILADIEGTPVKTLISGVIRGMIREGYDVKKGLKIADVDPVSYTHLDVYKRQILAMM